MRPAQLAHSLALTLALASTATGPALAAGETFDVVASDGIRLRATYWSPGKPGPGVLLLHMCNSERSAWNGLGPMLAARGLHALALDYRGYGESGGEREPTFQEQQRIQREKWPGDVDAALAALAARLGTATPTFGAAGGSCGVHEAVQVALRHAEVHALALLAGTTDAAGEAFLADNPWLPVFAGAAHDDGGAVETTRWVLGFSSNPANRFAEYAEGGHGTEIFRVHADLEPAIADWFAEHLIRHPVARPAPGSPEAAPRPGPSATAAAGYRERGGAAATRARIAETRAAGQPFDAPPEGVVNGLGYQWLGRGEHAEAIAWFELNVELHPDSANAHDSLGDAYLAAGRHTEARHESDRALALLPDDPARDNANEKAIRESARAKLEQLAASER